MSTTAIKPFPAPTENQKSIGWKSGYSEMQRLTDILEAEYDEEVTMEQMDSVIQCLVANGYMQLESNPQPGAAAE